jgi:hypothetical protein
MRGRVFAGFDLLWQAGRLTSLVLGGVAAVPWASALSTTWAGYCCWGPARSGSPGYRQELASTTTPGPMLRDG